ncbi:hypothetical protein F511_28252 [Dorcoceras hygrometricum]|uniref:Uncharacterized protein n=1 Tax=Dorcoceras hygrometricum TaxID=472368 RepID=A0A2Z7B928_9LAMI|nr:hypothetical protein F511_28252 [Dorcoceras hygrometricum]
MEDKKLNFSRPFLSVRRNSPADGGKTCKSEAVAPQLPCYQSEVKFGPIRIPGAVPFQWEQTPGQPKEASTQETRDHHRPPIAPKLPPGRCPPASQQHSRQVVPNENSSQIVTAVCDSPSGLNHDENLERYDEITEKGMHSESGDSDEVYVDAPDTLSRTESYFINCSVSGLSGFDDADTEPSERFLTDPKTREFMMDRFLPAAKAMASETPQCAFKKESIAREQPQRPTKMVSRGKPLLRYGSSFAKRYSYGHETEEEDEESDDDYDQHKKFPGVCGLLPRFCSRSSLSILNAVPAMSTKTRVPIHAANTNQTRSSSTSARSYSVMENESKTDKPELKSIIIEQSKPEKPELKSMDTVQTSELELNKTNPGNEHVQLEIETKHTWNDAKTFQELLSDPGSPKESDAGEPAMGKTLHVDTVKIVETESTASCSPPTEEDANGVPVSGEAATFSANKVDPMQVMDISPEALKKLDRGHEKGNLNLKGVNYVAEAYGEHEDVNLSSTDDMPPKALALAKGTHPYDSRFPVPPSLPKSPSDSWLGRTLPSISMKKSYLPSAINTQNNDPKAPRGDITWETFVKSTKVQQHHSCHSKASCLVASSGHQILYQSISFVCN